MRPHWPRRVDRWLIAFIVLALVGLAILAGVAAGLANQGV